MEDREIILLLKSAPSEGLRAAIQAYRGGVYAIISRILHGKKEDVEECVADTFLRVWKVGQAGRTDPDTDTFKGFVYSIARNVALTRYGRLAQEQLVPFEDAPELAAGDDVLAAITQSETSEELQQAVLDMPEPDRQIFFRRYFLFESIEEIARQTGCTAVQVKNRLYRGKARLQAALMEKECYLETIG